MKKGRIIFLVCLMHFSLFLYKASGQEQLSSPSVEGVSDSVVEFLAINQDDPDKEILLRGTGFFLENNREDRVTVVTVFNFFNILSFLRLSVTFEMQYKGKTFSLEGAEISLLHLQNLAIIHLPKEKFDMGPSVKPLQMRDTPLERGELLFIDGFPIGHFERIGAIDIKYHKDWDTLAFMMDRTNMVGATGAPLVDKNEKLVSILMRSFYNYGYGFKDVTELNELMKAESCTNPLTDCILEAGKKLYDAAKAGDVRSQLLLFQINEICAGCFVHFLRSIGVLDDSTRVLRLLDGLKKQASESYLGILYLRMVWKSWGPRLNRREIESFWQQGNQLAEEEGYPDIRYMLCDLSLEKFEKALISPDDILKCFLGSARQGFSQSQWAVGGLYSGRYDIVTAFEWWGKAALQGHYDACDMVTKLYIRQGDKCQPGELSCDTLAHVYKNVKDICQNEFDFPLAPYISMGEGIFIPHIVLPGVEDFE